MRIDIATQDIILIVFEPTKNKMVDTVSITPVSIINECGSILNPYATSG